MSKCDFVFVCDVHWMIVMLWRYRWIGNVPTSPPVYGHQFVSHAVSGIAV